jgi:putative aminopeptidase FrvX
LTWEQTRIVTGLSTDVLRRLRIREGTRVVMARERRKLWEIGNNLLGSYFFDDRADIAAWLLALERLIQTPIPRQKGILFAVTTSEEVGGEGALYLLHEYRPPVCIALEIGPSTPDAPFPVDSTPTLWVSDSFAAMSPRDILRVEDAAQEAGLGLYRQALSRGGSDASCAASKGLCARPITLAFAAENSHGFEIMHRDAPQNLATLLVTLLKNGVIPNPA